MNVSRLVLVLLLVVITVTSRMIRTVSSEVPSTSSAKEADVDTRVRYCSRRFYGVVKTVCGHCQPGSDMSLATICCNEGCRLADVRKGCCPEPEEPKN